MNKQSVTRTKRLNVQAGSSRRGGPGAGTEPGEILSCGPPGGTAQPRSPWIFIHSSASQTPLGCMAPISLGLQLSRNALEITVPEKFPT